MVHRALVSIADSETDSVDVLGVSSECLEHGISGDGKHLWWVESTVIQDIQDLHSVEEGSDLELVQEGSLTWGNLITISDDLDSVDDFDLTFDNLGLDVQGLEERGLLGVKTGWTSWDGHISVSKGADLGWGLSNLGVNDGLNSTEVSVGEDHADVKLELVSDQLELGLLFLCVLINHLLKGFSHESLNRSVLSYLCV